MELGSLPEIFGSAKTGKGAPTEWKVVPDASAEGGKAPAQVSTDRTDYRFPLAIYKPFSAKDIEAMVHCKPVAGKVDQACGVAVRLTSADDYYIARAKTLAGPGSVALWTKADSVIHFDRISIRSLP